MKKSLVYPDLCDYNVEIEIEVDYESNCWKRQTAVIKNRRGDGHAAYHGPD